MTNSPRGSEDFSQGAGRWLRSWGWAGGCVRWVEEGLTRLLDNGLSLQVQDPVWGKHSGAVGIWCLC